MTILNHGLSYDIAEDVELARERGSKDVFMNILTSNGLVGRFVTDWAGPCAVVRRVKIRLGAPNYPGDTMTMTGEVVGKSDGLVEVRVRGVAYMEAVVRPVTWADWPEAARKIFQALRSPAGEEMVLQKNVFVERILPASVLRGLAPEELARYRAPYREPGESRRPTLTWPREIPIEGEPADVVALVEAYAAWLAASPLPKLFVNADPGTILTGPQREFCRTWPAQEEVTVRGSHFIQEDSPDEIGRALAAFVRRLR